MKNFLKFIERWFTLLSLAFFIGNPIAVLTFGSLNEEYHGSSSILEPLLSSFIYTVATLLLIIRWKQVLYKLIEKNRLIWLVILVVIIAQTSFLWSTSPDVTLRRSALLTQSTLFGIYFGTHYSLKQQIELLGWSFSLVTLASLFFCIALPQYGIMHGLHQGAWRGVFVHKNGLGGSMSLCSVLFLILLMGKNAKKWSTWIIFALSVCLMSLSRSSTSLVTFLSLILFLILYRAFRLRDNVMIPVLITVLLVASGTVILLVAQQESFVRLLGKDLTLTGRTDLWPLVWLAIQKQPLLGYGYEGFWLPQNGEALSIWQATGWKPSHPHNGTLKILLEVGWLGTSIFLFSFFTVFLKTLFLVNSTRSSEYYWPIALLTFVFLVNLTESVFLVSGITWILYVAICLLMPDKEKLHDQARFDIATE